MRVRVRDRSGSWSGWSEPVRAEAGLLDPSDWTARFVSPRGIGGLDQPAPVLSAEFSVPEGAVSARLYSTAHGIYVADLNGRRVSEDQFAPGWTAYDARLRYQVYDVTSLVAPGRNVLTALLGNGWYRGRLGYLGDRAVYGDRLAFLAQLEITMASGDVITIATDAHWRAPRAASSRTTSTTARPPTCGIRRRHTATHDVDVIDTDHSLLVAAEGPPVRETQVLPAQRVWRSPSGRTLVDFGQNAVGRVRLRVRESTAGQQIVIRHAEVLENDELGTRPLRAAEATDRFILSGRDERGSGAAVHVPRLPLRRGHRSRRPPSRRHRPRRPGQRTAAHGMVHLVGRRPQPAPRERGVGDAGQLPGRADRLSSARRAARVDRRHPDLRPHRVIPVRRRRLPQLVARRPLRGAAAGRHGPAHRARHLQERRVFLARRGMGRCGTIVPWVLYERTGDRGILERQFDSARRWVDAVRGTRWIRPAVAR